MPIEQIKIKMQQEGFSPDLLGTPDAVSPNDAGVCKWLPNVLTCFLLFYDTVGLIICI